MAVKKQFPPSIKISSSPQEFQISSFISDLNGPGKEGQSGVYWMARVLLNGEEHTWFINKPERDIIIDNTIAPGDTVSVFREGSGEYNARGQEITAVLVELVSKGTGAAPVAKRATRAPSKAYSKPAEDASDRAAWAKSLGWTSSYRANPDLSFVPGEGGTPQSEIFDRLCGCVGDELALFAKQKLEMMLGTELNGKAAIEAASALQATFATLVISWKDLGYPATAGECIRAAAGSEPGKAKWE